MAALVFTIFLVSVEASAIGKQESAKHLVGPARDSKSGERGEHALAIFLPLLC